MEDARPSGLSRPKFEDGLNDHDVETLAPSLGSLVETEGWRNFLELVKSCSSMTRQAAFADSKDNFDYWRGFVVGFEEPVRMIMSVLKRAAELEERKEKSGRIRTQRTLPDEGDLTF